MSRASLGISQPRPHSGRKTLRRCKNNGGTGNIVLIDVEVDDFDNVIVIDVPESPSKKVRGSSSRKNNKYPQKNVICIDDDESEENDRPDDGVKVNGNLFNGSSSSPAANDDEHSSDLGGDECQFVQENISPVKISKCKRTYSGKASARNRFGLGSDSEIDLSDDDFPDCELVEDSLGKFREQWEKASLKRKCENRYDQSSTGVPTNGLRVSPNIQQSVGVEENVPEQHKNAPVFSCSGKPSNERDESSSSTETSNNPPHSSCNSEIGSFGDHNSDPLAEESSVNQDHQKFEHGGPSSQDTGQGTQGSASFPLHEEAGEQVNFVSKASEGERTPPIEPCTSDNDSDEENFCDAKASLAEEPQPESSKFNDNAELRYAKSSHMNTKISDERIYHDWAPSSDHVGSVPGENFYCRSTLFNSEIIMGEGHHQKNGELFDEKLTSCNKRDINEAVLRHKNPFSLEVEEELVTSVSNGHLENQDGVVHARDGEIMHETENCIINDREKLKETDEYKKAIEEEWAARQQELQIQAEEAQRQRRLLKRKKAEHMRLVDMERRQKLRLEEIRETQKKDEEHTNLKDLMRAEIRKELSKLELTCHDMASLLRSLGIPVGNDLKPPLHEVRAACKRALFTFHPDRASKSDTRQQVESEEKFKLISRMKDKFTLT